MTLSDAQLERYARHIVLREIGGEGQKRLLGSHVVMIGAGGIGSPAIQYLVAAGIGTISVIDDDIVDASNLQRQTIFATDDVGEAKVAAAQRFAVARSADVALIAIRERIDAGNAERLLSQADAVIDGSDNFETRLAVSDAATRLRIPLISAAIGQFDAQLAVYRGWEAGKPCYRCLVGDAPARPEASCAEQGVLGALAGMIGSLAALEAIRAIVPFGADPAGSLLLADALGFRFRTIALRKDPGCACVAT